MSWNYDDATSVPDPSSAGTESVGAVSVGAASGVEASLSAAHPSDTVYSSGTLQSSSTVQSLARGLDVIRSFDAEHPSMTLTEVAGRTGLSRATARRFLLTLAELGYVRFDGKYFELTSRVLQLGYSYLSSHTLPQIIEPALEQLSGELNESCSASVLDDDDIVYIARVHTRRIMRIGISVGTRLPAFATSMGRVLLAYLPVSERDAAISQLKADPLTPATITTPEALARELDAVREQGFCVVNQELEVGLQSVAVPVFGPEGDVVCALNVSMSVVPGTTAAPRLETIVPALKATADRIGADLRAKK